MKIKLSECDIRKNYESLVVERIVKKSKKEYSLFFGDYELLFLPETDSDKEYLKKIFNKENSLWNLNPKIGITIKKNNKIFLDGEYEVSEFIEEGDYKGALEIHVVSRHLEEFRIYIIPESHESISKIFEKIFE